jgi:hypothetical protein
MITAAPETMNAAQKAWATRRARDAARADIQTLNAGIETPAPALKTSKPIVDIEVDHHAIGCGTRRFIVLDCGPRTVRLFSYASLIAINVDRLTFDRKAKYARDAKRITIARILRQNLKQADRINAEARKASDRVSDGGADAAKALEVLR